MDADWVTSPSARRVLQHDGDSRPAWLWSHDGQTLLWQNAASRLFFAKLKKHGLKLAPLAVPIKGQVARNIRLGASGRSSLARIQFLAGEKPASTTCATTPLTWRDGSMALLVVAVDSIDPEILAAADDRERPADESVQGAVEAQTIDAELAKTESRAEQVDQDAGDRVAELIDADEHAYERELENWRAAEQDAGPKLSVSVALDADAKTDDAEPIEQTTGESAVNRLSQLVEKLAADENLYTPLTDADAPSALVGEPPLQVADIASEAEPLFTQVEVATPNEPQTVEQAVVEIAPKPADPETVERVSRYNFDELSRILNDRIGDPAPPAPTSVEPSRGGALINLGGETLVLNRLPLGILVFRDQQILFANRAITEMVGYDSVESLRTAGLAAVFPAIGPDGQGAGPVNHLMQRDGALVPVTARLQSISWQGRPALMLSASTTEVRTGHEAAVNAFAQTFADLRKEGFFEATRSGVISAITPRGADLLEIEGSVEGKPLSGLVGAGEISSLRDFLERPARFAESARPCLTMRSASGKAEITLFAQGQAGVVSGYFGFIRSRETANARIAGPADVDPALLARISRGVRRPLNTIIGFSDLIRTEVFGALQNERYESYAQDITTAGHEIAALVDELDDYARLRDGRYLPERASIDLTTLLESCVMRIRQQASGARVIVRNAISERLPRITADRASLAQAVLNLLASAIDQTPTGGAVVISAQREDDGAIEVHVRDSSNNAVDMAERFVVFRDGLGRDGQMMTPVRSSVGLALTRSLLAVNAFSLSVDPAGEQGMLFTLIIPADLVEEATNGEH